jgi:ATP-dependent Lon protease
VKPLRGGLALVGEINLGGSIETVPNPVELAEIAAEKGAKALLVPVSARRQMVDLSDDLATKLDVEYYKDAQDALLKSLAV